jgi:putative ABC transport system permease protein
LARVAGGSKSQSCSGVHSKSKLMWSPSPVGLPLSCYNQYDMNKMIVANLVHRPMRSVISVIAIAVEVTLILIIVGLSLGMLNDAANRTRGVGADVMVQPPNASQLAGFNGAPMPIKIGDIIAKLPHVADVSPVVWQANTAGTIEIIYGIDIDSFQKLGGPFHFLQGGPFTGPDQVLVDDYVANQNHIHAGQQIKILNHMVTVAGVVEHGKGARKFLPIKTLQDWIGAQGKASIFYVKADNPKNTNLIISEIHNISGLENYTLRSMQEYLSMMTSGSLPGLSIFISVVIGVAVVIGFIVIFQAMYTAVMERTREIGILKSLGASKFYIVQAILRETTLLAVLGTILGFGISYATRMALHAKFVTLPVVIYPKWLGYAAAIAIGGALLGAIYPAYKAARKDPIDALAYE